MMTLCSGCGGVITGAGCFPCAHRWHVAQMQRLIHFQNQNQLQNQLQNMARPAAWNNVWVGAVPVNSFGVWLLPATPHAPIENAGMKVEDLIGWRIWRFQGGELCSYAIPCLWQPGIPATGNPTDHGCEGVWAFKDKRSAEAKARQAKYGGHTQWVWGSVRLWGSVVEHTEGYRAENARIVSIDGCVGVTSEQMGKLLRDYGLSARSKNVVVNSGKWTGSEKKEATALGPLVPETDNIRSPWPLGKAFFLGMVALSAAAMSLGWLSR